MASQRDLKICIDESVGRRTGQMLVLAHAPGHPDIYDMRDLGFADQRTSDEVLMIELARQDIHVLITKDIRMLAAAVRRDAWRVSGLTLFLLDGR